MISCADHGHDQRIRVIFSYTTLGNLSIMNGVQACILCDFLREETQCEIP